MKKVGKTFGYLNFFLYISLVIENDMRNKLNFSVLSKIEKEFGNFEIGQTWGGGNPVYLRFGYWNQVDVTKLNEILNPLNEVVEDEWYDDDCGYQYNYKLL